ncbi:kinesin-like protein KIF26B [Pteropus alecto]|uniref:kinesin-like protein KIF26B n=1 Tax=Pteropus alecto TaxID=9402 RepID=UPI000D534315|nr:kinesin-like protein KIF26B [Pteropus alecto]
MNSVAGNKERLAVSTRGKKYGVNEVCSPTKPAASFSPESWYRKAYEESRASSRPTPEGAGSALGSSGTPSPGSGTSSPSSFTGSPGPRVVLVLSMAAEEVASRVFSVVPRRGLKDRFFSAKPGDGA